MEKNKLVAVYGRVSTSNQEDQKTIEAQLSEVRDFACKQGYTIVREYLDEGWSGDILARPSLDQLRHDARNKIWDAVLIYDPDRLGRRLFYQQIVIDELKQIDVDVLFVTTPPVLNAGDELMFGVKGLFAQYEKTKITERFRIGKVNRVKNNQILLSEAPYGYDYINNNGKRGNPEYVAGHCEINEYEAKIVQDVFSWVGNEGLTLRAVVRRLQDLNIQPRKSKRGVWNTSTLSTLLRNKTYIGQAHWGSSYAVVPLNPTKKSEYKKVKKTSRKMRPESDWLAISTPKIIDEDLFRRAGENLRSNFLMSSRNTKNEYLLTGKIWCDCGVRRAGEGPQQGKHLYYRCTSRVKSFPLPSACNEKGLNARIVDQMVWEKVAGLMTSPDLLLKQADRWAKNKQKVDPNLGVNTDYIKIEIDKLKEQENRYTKAYGAGIIGIDQLKEQLNPLKEKISLFESQIYQAGIMNKKEKERALPELIDVQKFSAQISEYITDLNFNAKKAIIKNIIDRVVGNRDQLQVYGFIPVTSNINVFTEYRNRRPTKRRKINIIQRSD